MKRTSPELIKRVAALYAAGQSSCKIASRIGICHATVMKCVGWAGGKPRPRFPKLTQAQRVERFWKKVDRRGPNECWVWLRGRNTGGYGATSFGKVHYSVAHRIAWELANGRKADPDKVVMHTCDNPPCCNPRHLRLGTHLDNNRDMVRKGRSRTPVGTAYPNSILTEQTVKEIRSRYKPYLVMRKDLAMEYGVSLSTIERVVGRKGWRHVPETLLTAQP